MGENLLKAGTATFYIVDEKLDHKEGNPFISWLRQEGFERFSLGHPNCLHALYINVNSKVYTWGMGGVQLAPVIFNHAIHIDEFKTIYEIFKKYESLPIGYYSTPKEIKEDESVIQKNLKWKNMTKDTVTYEEWCEGIIEYITQDEDYIKMGYDRSRVIEDMMDADIQRTLKFYYDSGDHALYVGGDWYTITF